MLVTLGPAVSATLYDEVAVYSRELSSANFSDHYAGSLVSPLADPQSDAIGYEEVYGGEYTLTTGDVPTITNGLCRARYVPALGGWALDAWLPGIGWQEQGRIYPWYDDTSGGQASILMGTLVAAQVMEWTPERAVLRATFTATAGGSTYRSEVYITLQRGWLGPRLETYIAPRGATKLGAYWRYVGYGGAYTPLMFSSGTGTLATEPWITMIGQPRSTHMTWPLVPSAVTSGTADTTAYGSARSYMQAGNAQGGTYQGYAAVRLAHGLRGQWVEAESGAALGATASVQADGAATGGSAVRDTQTAATTVSLTYPVAQLARLQLGKYQVWARVRVGTAGDTVSVTAGFTGSITAAATSTSTTYVWLYVGETTHGAVTDTLVVTAWRSAGTGVAGEFIDEIALVPVEGRNAATDPAYGGARDLWQEALYDTRYEPELVGR
jgi:hypothetical protein